MLTRIFECELWNSGTSFFRSAICGLSTAATVIVVVPPPPPPPPAPGEQAAPTTAMSSPKTPTTTGLDLATPWSSNRSFPSVIDNHPLSAGPDAGTGFELRYLSRKRLRTGNAATITQGKRLRKPLRYIHVSTSWQGRLLT